MTPDVSRWPFPRNNFFAAPRRSQAYYWCRMPTRRMRWNSGERLLRSRTTTCRRPMQRCFGDGVQCPSCRSPQNGGTAVRLARTQGSFWWKGRSTLDRFVRLAVGQSRVRAEAWLVLRIVRGRVYSYAYIALLRPQRWPNFIFYKSAVPTDYFFAPAILCLTTGNP